MIAFDSTLNLVGLPTISVPSEEQIKDGEDSLEVGFPIGIALPFSADGSTPLLAPIGMVRFRMNRKLAEEFFGKGLEAVQHLPEARRSEILRASSMSEVEAAAQRIAKVTRP